MFEISIFHLLHHKITSNTSSMEVDLVELQILWWEIDEMNENGNLKELMKKMKERENVLKVKKFIKSIWLYFYLALFLMISDWFHQMNEVEIEMNQFYINIVQPCFSERIPFENFYHIKIHFIQSKSKRKIENETKWMIKAKLSLFFMFSKKMNNEININLFKIMAIWIFSFDLIFTIFIFKQFLFRMILNLLMKKLIVLRILFVFWFLNFIVKKMFFNQYFLMFC